MGVLAAGTEPADFTLIGAPTINTSAGTFNSSNTRLSLLAISTEDTIAYDLPFASTAEIWVHSVVYFATGLNSTQKFWKLYSGGTQRLAIFFPGASNSNISVAKWNGSSWTTVLTSAVSTIPASTLFTLDVRVKLGNPGIISVYLNGSPILSDNTLDVTFSGVTGFDKLRLQSAYSSSFSTLWSEIIVADFNTIGSKVVSRVPDANGNYTAWTGTFADIDETSGGTDVILSGSVGDRESWTHTNFPALGTGESIAQVGMGISALRDAGGPQSLNMFTRISGTDYDQADETVNVSSTNLKRTWDVNPATSAAWAVAEIDAAEFGVRSRT